MCEAPRASQLVARDVRRGPLDFRRIKNATSVSLVINAFHRRGYGPTVTLERDQDALPMSAETNETATTLLNNS